MAIQNGPYGTAVALTLRAILRARSRLGAAGHSARAPTCF